MAGNSRVLLQPPGRIRVPVGAEGNVDPESVASRDQYAAQFLIDAEQHLEFILLWREGVFADQPK